MKLKIIAICLVMFGALQLVGCHTFKGFGQDVQAGGTAIQEAATNAQS